MACAWTQPFLVFRAESRWPESLPFRASAPQATSAEVRCHGSSLRTVSDTIPYSHGAANMTLEPYLCGLFARRFRAA